MRNKKMLLSFSLLALLVSTEGQSSTTYCGDTANYYGTNGTIYSPNYPSNYLSSSNCTYNWYIPTLSSISLTISFLDMEICCDYVELSCRSHSVTLPTRYTGRAFSSLAPMTFEICTQVVIKFYSDSSVTGGGYVIRYRAIPIECPSNCTLLPNSYGYVCSCDANETNITMPTIAPNPQCKGGCDRMSSPYSYCKCLLSATVPTTRATCSPGCSSYYDFDGYLRCSCSSTSTTSPCASGCYRTTDWMGYPYCYCPSSSISPISCPNSCYRDSDYWGNPYCNCAASTQPPIWCSPGCTSDTDVYGNRYCNCPTTTYAPCYSPCYYSWDYTYDYAGRRFCYCPPTTTQPPPTGCNQTLTASYGTVTSPNYPNMYPKGIDCYQYIDIPTATAIRIRVTDVEVFYSSSTTCVYEYVEIAGCDGNFDIICSPYSIPYNGYIYQCTDSSKVTVRFHSYSGSYYTYRGFKFTYSATFASNCSESGQYVSRGSSGLITSPNYPNNFPGYSECVNYLFADDDIKITILFAQFRLEDTSTCEKVYLKFTCQDDGVDNSKTVCGSQIPAPMTFDCRVLQISFRSNATTSFSPRSFSLRYLAVTNTPSTVAPAAVTVQPGSRSDETDLPQSSKLGIGLGVGVGGFFLIILIVIIIILIVNGQRQATRREQVHLEDLAIISRSLTGAPSGVHHLQVAEGFSNPLHEVHEGQKLNVY